jgi:surfactin synthase thioesterase subunit/NAD(P)-dependent dehydrogenase (short-subunit alcohol dehydrogenase family)/acyl carrier protein
LGVREVVGRVESVSADVRTVAVGDVVVGLLLHDPAGTHVSLPAGRCAKVPAELAPARAASGCAALLCMDRILRLDVSAPGAILWLHSSDPVLARAAASVTRARGLEVIVSSIDPSVIDVAGVEVIDARSVRLADDLREALSGRRPELAILVDPLPAHTCLADALSDAPRIWHHPAALARLDAALPRRARFAPFDVQELIERHPDPARALSGLLHELVEARIDALPFRVLLEPGTPVAASPLNVLAPPQRTLARVPLCADATYLITGGLGGLGLTLARHFAAAGAGRIVLASRRGADTEHARAAVAEIERSGAEVVVVQADASKRADVVRLLELARSGQRPLRGVVHAAMVLEDSTVAQLDPERIRRVLAPKVDGALHLDELTRSDQLDFFALFSSFASIVGNPGQGAYAAANAVLDAIAVRRRARGLHAVSIGWGSVGGAGYVAAHTEIDAHLRRIGLSPFAADRATHLFDRLIARDVAHIAAIDIDWARFCAVHACGAAPRFAELRCDDTAQGDEPADACASTLVPPLEVLRAEIARALRMRPTELDADVPLTHLGFDSLMAVELRSTVRKRLDVDIPAMKIMGGPTLRALAAYIEEQRVGPTATPARVVPIRAAHARDRWLVCPRKLDRPRARLFCIPYNGGSVASFASWSALLPDDVELWTVQLPGQIDRQDEAPLESLAEWARGAAEAMSHLLDRPYALYGHSLGGLVGFELARELRRRGTLPEWLFVAAIHAAHLPDPFPDRDRLTDHATLDRLGMLRALTPLLEDERLMQELRPIVRAGADRLKTYRFVPEAPLECAIVALGGSADAIVLAHHLDGWRDHASRFESVSIAGGHLFHQERPADVVDVISTRMSTGNGELGHGV